MEINSANIEALFRGYDILFQEGLLAGINSGTIWWNKIASEMPSDADTQVHAWLADIPRMEKWIGERTFTALATHDYSLQNADWQRGIKISRNRIEDDKYAVYGQQIKLLGHAAAKWADEMIYQMFSNESTQMICYDGQDFFSSSHPIDATRPELGNYSNSFTGRALSIDNFWYVAQQMMTVQSESGRPMGIWPNLLVVAPQQRQIANQIAKAAMIAPQTFAGATQVGGQTNTLMGEVEVLVVPEFASINSGNTWFLLDTTKPVKPFVFQNRRPPRTLARVDAALDNLFNRREYEWGVDSRGAAGCIFPQFAAKAAP